MADGLEIDWPFHQKNFGFAARPHIVRLKVQNGLQQHGGPQTPLGIVIVASRLLTAWLLESILMIYCVDYRLLDRFHVSPRCLQASIRLADE